LIPTRPPRPGDGPAEEELEHPADRWLAGGRQTATEEDGDDFPGPLPEREPAGAAPDTPKTGRQADERAADDPQADPTPRRRARRPATEEDPAPRRSLAGEDLTRFMSGGDRARLAQTRKERPRSGGGGDAAPVFVRRPAAGPAAGQALTVTRRPAADPDDDQAQRVTRRAATTNRARPPAARPATLAPEEVGRPTPTTKPAAPSGPGKGALTRTLSARGSRPATAGPSRASTDPAPPGGNVTPPEAGPSPPKQALAGAAVVLALLRM